MAHLLNCSPSVNMVHRAGAEPGPSKTSTLVCPSVPCHGDKIEQDTSSVKPVAAGPGLLSRDLVLMLSGHLPESCCHLGHLLEMYLGSRFQRVQLSQWESLVEPLRQWDKECVAEAIPVVMAQGARQETGWVSLSKIHPRDPLPSFRFYPSPPMGTSI